MESDASSAGRDTTPVRLSLRKRLAFSLFVLLFVLGLVELSLRIVWQRPPATLGEGLVGTGLFEADEELGWRMAPNQVVDHPAPGGGSYRIVSNARGFRDIEPPGPKAEGETRVVVLGDSFPWGYFVEVDETFPAVLRETLPEATVVNLGVTGYNLVQSHRLLVREGLAFEPDLVVLSFCQNDVGPRVVPPRRANAPKRTDRGWKAWMRRNVYLYDFVRTRVSTSPALRRLFTRIGLKEAPAGYEDLDPSLRPSLKSYPPELEANWSATMEELVALARTVEAANARLLVVSVPAKQHILPDELVESIAYLDYLPADFDARKPYRRLADACRAAGIDYLDPYDAFEQGGADLYLEFDMHFSPAGHRRLAELLVPRIRAVLD